MMSMTNLRTDIAVIGGGAAGLMAAITAAEAGAQVIVIEKGEQPLRKLKITGKGRCNITNNCTVSELLLNIPRNGRFLYSALTAFTPADTMVFFERLGLKLKVERGNRVFPMSDKAADAAEALLKYADTLGIKIIRARAENIGVTDKKVTHVDCGTLRAACKAAIVCTGGLSYPKTGSDGDGYKMVKRFEHSVTPLLPSLVPLTSNDPDCKAMQGLSLKNVVLTLKDRAGVKLYEEMGEMQFTHFGISGPLVLSASAHMKRSEDGRFAGGHMAEIDLKPALSQEKLDERILRDFNENKNRAFKNSLDGLLPRLMIPVAVKRSEIPPDLKVNSITREQRQRLVKLLKCFKLEITGTRPVEEAVITSGGIEIKEIKPSTMESKLIGGLYFAGEIIDADAYTGGFNLQIAWSTAYAAGKAAAESVLYN
jgi:predicted Rossmann fold flavoprotein